MALDLRAHEVHLWCVRLDNSTQERDFAAWLNAQEVQRAQRFYFPIHRLRFIIARSNLRRLLGAYLDLAPKAVQLLTGEKGKPYIAESELQFNVSHSHDLAVYAFTREAPIGVDVEKIDTSFKAAVAKRYFSLDEYTMLMALPPAAQSNMFYRIWSRKEALIKAIGQGLHYPLASFSVGSETVERLVFNEQPDWYLQSFTAHPDYQSAFATHQTVSKVYFGEVNPAFLLKELKTK